MNSTPLATRRPRRLAPFGWFTRNRRPPGRRQLGLLSGLSLLFLLFSWWILAIAIDNQLLLPRPPLVIEALVDTMSDGSLIGHIRVSLTRVLVGFLLATAAAVPVGFLLGWYRTARSIGEPWLQFLRVIPPIAIIPLVIIYLGIGEEAKVFLIFWAAFLQIVIAVFAGVRALDSTTINAGRVLGARDSDIFFDIALPASVPFILVGMRIGLAAAWTTLVAAELIASSQGLGYMIVQAGTYRDVPVIILGIVLIGIIGLLLDRALLGIDRRVTAWQDRRET